MCIRDRPLTAEKRGFEESDSLVNQLQHFHRVLRGEEVPLVGGREGLQSLRVIEAIQQAARTGEKVAVEIGINSTVAGAALSSTPTSLGQIGH